MCRGFRVPRLIRLLLAFLIACLLPLMGLSTAALSAAPAVPPTAIGRATAVPLESHPFHGQLLDLQQQWIDTPR